MGRVIGIDYGRKRIGLAVSDPAGIFASPLKTVNNQEFFNFIDEFQKKDKIDAFVVGYPMTMNNMPSESVKYTEPFIRKLKSTLPGIPVFLEDERFTSKIAMDAMIAGGMKKKERQIKGNVDRISAAVILQSFLDNKTKKEKIFK
jgi:putative Holliday junction resolvase